MSSLQVPYRRVTTGNQWASDTVPVRYLCTGTYRTGRPSDNGNGTVRDGAYEQVVGTVAKFFSVSFFSSLPDVATATRCWQNQDLCRKYQGYRPRLRKTLIPVA